MPFSRPSEIEAYTNMMKETELIHAPAIGEWLGRSDGLPLRISFASWSNYHFEHHGDLIIDSFISFSSRWHTIHLNCPGIQLAKIAAVKDFPMLESIVVEEQQDGAFSPGIWQNSGLLKAPNLTRVSLKNINYDITSLPLRWPQLTFLSLTGYHPGGDFSLPRLAVTLKSCVQLLILHLDMSMNHFSDTIPQIELEAFSPSTLTLPSLKELSVRTYGNGMAYFFQSLHTPSLLTFTFRTQRRHREPDFDFQCLLRFLSRPHGVRKLMLELEGFSSHLLIDLLQLCPQVASLSISGQGGGYWGEPEAMGPLLVNSSVLGCFVSDEAGPYLCSEMEEFECRNCASFTDEELLQFIMKKQDGSGIPPVAKLRRVIVTFDRTGTWPISEKIQRYVEEGLEVNVSYNPKPFFVWRQFSARDGLPLGDPYFVDPNA